LLLWEDLQDIRAKRRRDGSGFENLLLSCGGWQGSAYFVLKGFKFSPHVFFAFLPQHQGDLLGQELRGAGGPGLWGNAQPLGTESMSYMLRLPSDNLITHSRLGFSFFLPAPFSCALGWLLKPSASKSLLHVASGETQILRKVVPGRASTLDMGSAPGFPTDIKWQQEPYPGTHWVVMPQKSLAMLDWEEVQVGGRGWPGLQLSGGWLALLNRFGSFEEKRLTGSDEPSSQGILWIPELLWHLLPEREFPDFTMVGHWKWILKSQNIWLHVGSDWHGVQPHDYHHGEGS
jgi:hypothetical protein